MENINKIFKVNPKRYYIFIVIIFLIAIFFVFFNQDKKENIKYVEIAGKIIKVELATTKEAQEKGLSGRENIKNGEGMLFVFKKSQKNYFWMKDMNFSIDIVWINKENKVVFIKQNAIPSSYPEIFGPDVDNKYVLELESGFSRENNLKIGEIVKFLP